MCGRRWLLIGRDILFSEMVACCVVGVHGTHCVVAVSSVLTGLSTAYHWQWCVCVEGQLVPLAAGHRH